MQIKNAEHEKQAGGKGVGKNGGLNNRADDNQGADDSSHKSGAFRLTVAEEEQTDRNPHHTNQ